MCNDKRSDPCGCHTPLAVSFCLDNHLKSISLGGNNVAGVLSPAIGSFTQLEYLILDNNHIQGSIPPTIGQLTALQVLDLGGGDSLTGEIPDGICNATALKTLRLYHNRLRGTIPACLGRLTKLKELYLYNNLLSGRVPDLDFKRIGRFCGIGDAKGKDDGNYYCNPLPPGARQCDFEGQVRTRGQCTSAT